MYITSYCIRNRKMDRIEYLTKKSLHKKRKWVKHMKGTQFCSTASSNNATPPRDQRL